MSAVAKGAVLLDDTKMRLFITGIDRFDLGLEPHRMVDALEGMLQDLMIYKAQEAAKEDVIESKVRWSRMRRKVSV